MIAVILQPSYLPWRGYFDQILRADTFVFYDDVQYDKHGWRNRNQIKTSGGKRWITIPVHSGGVTEGIPIKDVRIDWSKPWAETHLKSLTAAYAKAPYFKKYLPLLEGIYARRDTLIADFTIAITMQLAQELGITRTRFLRSSDLSGPSAREYLDGHQLHDAGISFEFMTYDYPEYPQLYPPFDPFVSILDLLFMTGDRAIEFIRGKEMLAHGSQ